MAERSSHEHQHEHSKPRARSHSKSSQVDLTPPADVAAAAEKGLKLRAEYRRGGTTVGIARARDLQHRKHLSEQTVKRMVSYFKRHNVDNGPTISAMKATRLPVTSPGFSGAAMLARNGPRST
jgi:hypothetical protein